jgi:methenyltetrahydrofolate cyclohydrolase
MAAGKPAPAGGSAAALTVAQAAALCAKTARLSARQLNADRADQLTTEADRIRTTAVGLVDQDARAYGGVIEHARKAAAARRNADARAADAAADPADPADAEDDRVSELMASLARMLSRAADVPMEIVELAAQVAGIAAPLAAVGNPALRGDAVAAALLAQAGARAAATLVAINLADSPDDSRPGRAFDLLAEIAHSVDQASAER